MGTRKKTLCKIILGIKKPDYGEISNYVSDIDIDYKKEEKNMEGALISGIAFTKDESEIMYNNNSKG